MPFQTDVGLVFEALGNRGREFDWLITDLECNVDPPPPLGTDRVLAGEVLGDLLRARRGLQFIWAVLSGVPSGTPLDLDALPVRPFADDNPDFWHGTPRIQYPDAAVEIVCWDSTYTLLMTADDDLTARFRAFFPEARDLEDYNAARGR